MRGGGSRLFLVFRIPAYRWLWGNAFTSANGFITFLVAQGWLILELTDSPFMVGLAPGMMGVANMVASPFGGVLADRHDRRTILMLAQGTTALVILGLGILTVTGTIEIWHIMAAAILRGLARGLEQPARSSLTFDLVGRAAIMNAMAGQFTAIQLASSIGPLGAGFLMAAVGPGPVIIAVGCVLMVGTLLLVPLPVPTRSAAIARSFWRNLKEGVEFAMSSRSIRTVIWVVLVTEILGFSSRTMLPVVTKDLLDAGPVVLGLMNTFWGVGGILAAVVLSSFGELRHKGWLFFAAPFIFGLVLISFSFSHQVVLSMTLLLAAGACGLTYDTLGTTLLQTLAPDAMRGRVMGLHGLLVGGFSVGALIMGTLASILGVTSAITTGGGLVATNSLRMLPVARQVGEQTR